MIDAVVELSNIEIHEHCMLNRITGERKYNNGKKQMPYFTGLYFKEGNVFFALYPTDNGPIMYYEGKERFAYLFNQNRKVKRVSNRRI